MLVYNMISYFYFVIFLLNLLIAEKNYEGKKPQHIYTKAARVEHLLSLCLAPIETITTSHPDHLR